MTREQASPISVERRCPNCGTRVARDADSCFMCGHNLRIQPRRAQRIAWMDVALVLAVVAVLALWWRLGSQPQQNPDDAAAQGILPGDVPLLGATIMPTVTITPTVAAEPTKAAPTYITHAVQAGETLLEIAGIYDISVEELQAANGLTDEFIQIDQELIIPVARAETAPTPSTVTEQPQYTVRPGDTIISIALTFGSTSSAILQANNLAQDALIRPGDVLIIPVSQLAQAALESTTQSPTGAANTTSENANTIYIEPRSIGPADAATMARDEAVLLRWISVDVLAPNEWYVVLIQSDNGQSIPSVWTKATSHRLETDAAPAQGQSVTYTWQVTVVRVKIAPNGQTVLEAASPPSETRTFIWQ